MDSTDPQPDDHAENAPGDDASARADRPKRREGYGGQGGLGGLVGGGGSQVGTNGAMRARDVSRPR